jgi:hypothetical protein
MGVLERGEKENKEDEKWKKGKWLGKEIKSLILQIHTCHMMLKSTRLASHACIHLYLLHPHPTSICLCSQKKTDS